MQSFLKGNLNIGCKTEGKKSEALGVVDDYVSDHNNFDAYWLRATHFSEEGELERAEQDYKKLTTLPQNPAAGYELLAGFYARTERLDQSVATIEEGLKRTMDRDHRAGDHSLCEDAVNRGHRVHILPARSVRHDR